MDTAGAGVENAPGDGLMAGRRWLLAGRVQGVGFRPFVYRLACAYGIRGFVQNLAGRVVVVGEGTQRELAQFGHALLAEAPPLARPRLASCAAHPPGGFADFRIIASAPDAEAEIFLPPDCFCCDDCVRELDDPHDRRYRYPFINCTQCGPRYTVITGLPYDRERTTMKQFAMCAACRAEYEDPGNRRFHAEPIGCPVCGPRLAFHAPGSPLVEDTPAALARTIGHLHAGWIVAVKGLGGYHLLADATSGAAVARLRQRKHRPHKPLALMFPADPAYLRRMLDLDPAAHAALFDPARPIVLVRAREGSGLAQGIHPGLNEVGVMLPYSPLHHLLLQAFGRPLVATSGNISGEPVLTDAAEAEARLAAVADCYLHHDRRIARPADDSVLRVIAGRPRPIRLGRGAAPVEVALPFVLSRPLLAAGSHMKNTLALGWRDRAIVAPHVGDLDSPRALAVFEQVAADLQALYGIAPAAVACDAHPGYASTRWAAASGLPLLKVQHHRAHASALAAEHPDVERWLVFAWDGIGMGDDGSLWGGEAFAGAPGDWRRVASLRPFRLVGAEQAGRAPWRSAAALCWETGHAWREGQHELVLQAWRRRVNCRTTSAAGRLFDGAAALVGLLDEASHEGQGPMWLEAIAEGEDGAPVPLPVAKNGAGLWEMDWGPLIRPLMDARQTAARRAAVFHISLAHGLLAQARSVRREHGLRHVGLTGGVFQNRRLAETALQLLTADGFDVRLAERLPCNDAALSFGQLVEAGARQ
ncbi:carbamoyltransferase HypF [Massilia niastensis]|uniref:carbamoyltransferase HypF n=1 Tax=Massilia niastensis TaxID=544911 RepID=UPI0003733DDE|nr:carbamoyltransferase HypF [Massilia niastensis]